MVGRRGAVDCASMEITLVPGVRHWSTSGLLDHIHAIHTKMPDRRFCFVLGAGASVPSGIPAGGALVRQWLEELQRREDGEGLSLEQWATPERLGIPGFQLADAPSFYPQLYQRRFGEDPEEGYAFLEDTMRDKEPSFGYSVLANILAGTPHRVVITTNFDNLVADALAIYCRKYPLVCGHESLAAFIRPVMRRPVIAKVHRDLLLNPLSEPEELTRLAPEWKATLELLFNNYTPVVIGYGGNDGGFMGVLKNLKKSIRGGIYWCYREGDGLPPVQIQEVVARHHGALVPILGFDEFMLQLGERLEIPLVGRALEEQVRQREDAYRQSMERLLMVLTDRGWWSVQRQAPAAPDLKKREATYEEALKLFPKSTELRRSFAKFLALTEKPGPAKKAFEEAINRGQGAAQVEAIIDFGAFYARTMGEPELAVSQYQRALDINPAHAGARLLLGNQLYLQNNLQGAAKQFQLVVQQLVQQPGASGLDLARAATNLCGVLMAQGDLARADDALKLAKPAVPPGTHLEAKWRLCQAMLARLSGGSDQSHLERLQEILRGGYEQKEWSFDNVLGPVGPKLGGAQPLYQALAAAVIDPTKLSELSRFPEWSAAHGAGAGAA